MRYESRTKNSQRTDDQKHPDGMRIALAFIARSRPRLRKAAKAHTQSKLDPSKKTFQSSLPFPSAPSNTRTPFSKMQLRRGGPGCRWQLVARTTLCGVKKAEHLKASQFCAVSPEEIYRTSEPHLVLTPPSPIHSLAPISQPLRLQIQRKLRTLNPLRIPQPR